jgi:hypothetical protein
MKVAIVGSRSFTNIDVLLYHMQIFHPKCFEEIISGGARGADGLARDYARLHNIPYTEYKPDWKQNGRAAGFRRNGKIVANSDIVIAFWDGRSKGTEYTIQLAKQFRKPVVVFFV